MDLRSRAAFAVLPTVFCIACGSDTGDAPAGPAEVPASDTAPTGELPFDAARPALRTHATTFLKSVLEYDARKAGRLDFLVDLDRLVTADELTRLAQSARAGLPWNVLSSRRERTKVSVQGASEATTAEPEVRVLVWVTVTTRTSFATVQQRELVTLSLVRHGSAWKVDDAEGAGL